MTNTTTVSVTIKPETSSAKKRIIKINQCPTLTNKSTLTYHIDSDEDKAIHFRLAGNTGSGFFNDDWIAFLDIQSAFEAWPVDDLLTSFSLSGLFTGKSANNPAFLMAALKEEKIVATLKDKRRNHEYIEPTEFVAEMAKLIESGINLESDGSSGNNKAPQKEKPATTKVTAKRTKKKA